MMTEVERYQALQQVLVQATDIHCPAHERLASFEILVSCVGKNPRVAKFIYAESMRFICQCQKYKWLARKEIKDFQRLIKQLSPIFRNFKPDGQAFPLGFDWPLKNRNSGRFQEL